MSVLVTGASGFIGGRLAQMLVTRGENVRVLVRETSDTSHLDNKRVEIAIGDLREQEDLAQALSGITEVYHAAAIAEDWGDWQSFYDTNVKGTENILEAAAKEKVRRFVHVSTTDVYGYPRQACDESRPIRDIGLFYNRSKVLTERAVMDCHMRTRLAVTIARPATVFGPRDPNWVGEFGQMLMDGEMATIGGGNTDAGLIYVDDAVNAMIALAISPRTVGEAYNLRDPASMTWRQFIDRLADGLGVDRARKDFGGTFAYLTATCSEWLHRMVRSRNRPLLTRHLVQFMRRPQDFGIDKLQQTVSIDWIGLDEGINRALAWLRRSLRSEE